MKLGCNLGSVFLTTKVAKSAKLSCNLDEVFTTGEQSSQRECEGFSVETKCGRLPTSYEPLSARQPIDRYRKRFGRFRRLIAV